MLNLNCPERRLVLALAILLPLLLVLNQAIFVAGLELITVLQQYQARILLTLGQGIAALSDLQCTMLSLVSFYLLRHSHPSLFVKSAFMLSLIILLKMYFKEPRPYWLKPQIRNLATRDLRDFGNPSGHTALLIVTADNLLQIIRPTVRFGWRLSLLLGVGFIVGVSRMYLGMHSLNQVLIGGVLSLMVCFSDLQTACPRVLAAVMLLSPFYLISQQAIPSTLYQLSIHNSEEAARLSQRHSTDTMLIYCQSVMVYPLLLLNRKSNVGSVSNKVVSFLCISAIVAEAAFTFIHLRKYIAENYLLYTTNIAVNAIFATLVFCIEDWASSTGEQKRDQKRD